MNKTLKKDQQKACTSGKRCYFCTRNNGEVLKVLKAGSEIKKVKIFSSKSLPEKKKSFTFAPRKRGSSLRDWQADLEEKGM